MVGQHYRHFMPVCAPLFNYFFTGERIYSQEILGGLLILPGVHRSLKA